MLTSETQLLLNAANIIDDYIRDEFIKQGHSLTGEWENSLQHNEFEEGSIEGLGKSYGFIVDKGILPERIPYGGDNEKGKGGISKYITALAIYSKQRDSSLTDKQALRRAFAIAEVQKREGMSTIASERFSSTGKRQDFLSSMKILFEDYLDNWIFEGLFNIIDNKANEPKKMYL